MARKGHAEALRETQWAPEARLQYLSRNHEFRQAIDSLTTLRDTLPGKSDVLTLDRFEALQDFLAKLEEAAAEWGVPWDLLSLLSSRHWGKNDELEKRIPAASVVFDSPVIGWTDTLRQQCLSPFLGNDPPEPLPEDSRYLNLRVDLNHPVDALDDGDDAPVSSRIPGSPKGRYRAAGSRTRVLHPEAE